jgi:O-antigen ligase
MSRVRAQPVATLLAVVSAILIVFGRVNRDLWWGTWTLVAGFAVLVVAGLLTLRPRR